MTGRQWELARIPIREGRRETHFIWQPPEPLCVLGVRFSRPTEILHVHLALECVATQSPGDARDFEIEFLHGAYAEWRPKKRMGWYLHLGSQFVVELKSPYPGAGWVELLHEFGEDRDARRRTRLTRRARQVAECLATLKAPVARPPHELDGVTRDIRDNRGPAPPRRR